MKQLGTIFLLFILISCIKENSYTAGSSEAKNYSVESSAIKYARRFSIQYRENYKYIKVYSSSEDTSTAIEYILIQKGKPKPRVSANAQIIETPIQSIVCLSSLYVAYIDKLGLQSFLKGVDNFHYINTPSILEMIEEKKIKEVGSNTSVNLEKLSLINPDLVFTYGTGNSNYDCHPKLQELGLKVAITVDHMEDSPLGRAEWIKFMAAFFDKEQEADSLFKEIEKEYNKLSEVARKVKDKPTVFTSVKYGDVWYMPGGRSYMAKLLEDAGAKYLWANDNTSGSLPLSFEQVYTKAFNAEFWINTADWKSTADAITADPRNAYFSAVKKANIYNNNLRINKHGGNDYWERGLLNPNLILADLIKIFHPELLPSHQLIFYKKLN